MGSHGFQGHRSSAHLESREARWRAKFIILQCVPYCQPQIRNEFSPPSHRPATPGSSRCESSVMVWYALCKSGHTSYCDIHDWKQGRRRQVSKGGESFTQPGAGPRGRERSEAAPLPVPTWDCHFRHQREAGIRCAQAQERILGSLEMFSLSNLFIRSPIALAVKASPMPGVSWRRA